MATAFLKSILDKRVLFLYNEGIYSTKRRTET